MLNHYDFAIIARIAILLQLVIICLSIPINKHEDFRRYNEETPGYFQGDMKFHESIMRGVGLRRLSARWTDGIVPYEIGPGFTNEQEELIIRSMRIIESSTAINHIRCILFRPKEPSDSYSITFNNGFGCNSYVGQPSRLHFNHTINLETPGCMVDGIIMHELLHTLGFFHEQSRPDRDSHVRILTENIAPGQVSQFEKYSRNVVDDLNTPYDYESLMHYGSHAFTNNGSPTIQTVQPNVKIGQRYYLSTIDIEEIRRYYNCSEDGVTLASTTPYTTTLSTNPNEVLSTYSSVLTNVSSVFARWNRTEGAFYFEAIEVLLPMAGNFTLRSRSPIDTFGYIYQYNFNPNSPAMNRLVQNDDGSGSGQFSILIRTGAPVIIIAVVTTYDPEKTGAFDLLVSGPATVMFTKLNISSAITTTVSTSTVVNVTTTPTVETTTYETTTPTVETTTYETTTPTVETTTHETTTPTVETTTYETTTETAETTIVSTTSETSTDVSQTETSTNFVINMSTMESSTDLTNEPTLETSTTYTITSLSTSIVDELLKEQ